MFETLAYFLQFCQHCVNTSHILGIFCICSYISYILCYNCAMNYVYILECKDGTFYTGWTNNLEKRVEKHNTGKGAKYTISRIPVVLKYYEKYETKEEAMRREYEIKQYSRQQKIQLIKSYKEE